MRFAACSGPSTPPLSIDMSGDLPSPFSEDEIAKALLAMRTGTRERVTRKIVAAALGAIPWIGGFLTAYLAFNDESAQNVSNDLRERWHEEHRRKIAKLDADMPN